MNVRLLCAREYEIALTGWAECCVQKHRPRVADSSDYIYRSLKPHETEPGKMTLHYCQRTTASGDCCLRPAGAERNRFGNAISGWAGRPYVSMGERPIEFTTSIFLRKMAVVETRPQFKLTGIIGDAGMGNCS